MFWEASSALRTPPNLDLQKVPNIMSFRPIVLGLKQFFAGPEKYAIAARHPFSVHPSHPFKGSTFKSPGAKSLQASLHLAVWTGPVTQRSTRTRRRRAPLCRNRGRQKVASKRSGSFQEVLVEILVIMKHQDQMRRLTFQNYPRQ